MLNHKEKIGSLDRRIVIQELTSTSDTYNQPVPTWATFATVWAKVNDRGVSEDYQADQLTANRSTVFVVRYLSGLSETMRILYDSKYYNIRGIRSPDRKRFLEVSADLLDDPIAVVSGGGAYSSAYSAAYD